MLIRMILVLCMSSILLVPKDAFALVRLAVLELQGTDVEASMLKILSDKVRYGVLHASKNKRISNEPVMIMTRENIMEVLQDQGKTVADCVGECELTVARNIGADYVISGAVSKLDSLYVLSVKLHETATGNLLAGKDLETESKRGLLSGAEQLALDICALGLGLGTRSQTVPSPQQEDFIPSMWKGCLDSSIVQKHLVEFKSAIADPKEGMFLPSAIGELSILIDGKSIKTWRWTSLGNTLEQASLNAQNLENTKNKLSTESICKEANFLLGVKQ